MIWLVLIALIAVLLVYFMIVRPWLRQQPALSAAFKAEASWFEQLQARITGWKTKIASRLLAIGGILIGFYDQILPLVAGQDWTPVTSKLPGWVLPVAMVAIAWLFDWLRKLTANPPELITQKIDTAPAQVVAVIQPVKA